ncbi:MAG: hypothetical protein JSR99_01235 [Proteobacteria bacterium]|nr:hypothetical protein [Pseudomonadota bacterium]
MMPPIGKPKEVDPALAGAELLNAVSGTISQLVAVNDAVHAAVLKELAKQQPRLGCELKRLDPIYKVVRSELSEPSTPLLGMGFAANPNVFDGPGLLWWYGGKKSRNLRPLQVGTRPTGLDFYDYTATRWWIESIVDDTCHIYGPYVDHSGTNAYVVTLGHSVNYGGAKVGLVVLDVLVGKLQSLWQSHLLRLPKPTSVVNREGIVIATNSGALMGGVLRSADAGTPIPGTDWQIAAGI